MPDSPRPFLRRYAWPAVYLTLALAFFALLARYHHPVYGFTSLFQLDASQESVMLPALRERPVYVYHDKGGYDGMFYAQLALSPLLRDPALRPALDDLPYRARRILGSAAAWLAGFGRPDRVLDAYALLNPFCWCALALLLLRVFPPRSLHDAVRWAGLLFSAGALGSVRLALTDLPALLLIAATGLLITRSHGRGAAGFLAAAALTRESALAALPALANRKLSTTAVHLLIALTPIALWVAYVRWVAGASAGLGNIGWPGAAFIQKWTVTFGDIGNEAFPLVPWLTLASLVGLTVQAAWTLLRPAWKNPWWRIAAGNVALLLCLGPAPWGGYPDAAARVLLPLHLAFNILAPRTRAGLALLVLGNLSLFAGLDQIKNAPSYPRELAAHRSENAAFIAQAGDGWHGVERRGARRWSWASGTATLQLNAWRAPAQPTALEFRLSALSPRTITIRHGETLLWSGQVDQQPVPVRLTLPAWSADATELVFTTDQPGTPETAAPDARRLAFSISDVAFRP